VPLSNPDLSAARIRKSAAYRILRLRFQPLKGRSYAAESAMKALVRKLEGSLNPVSTASSFSRRQIPYLCVALLLAIGLTGCGGGGGGGGGTNPTGSTAASLSPALGFAAQVNSPSAPQISTLTNTGSNSISIGGISITGTNAADFTETNTCGAALAPGASCTVSVIYNPSAAGTSTAELTVSDNASAGSQSVALSGTATGAVGGAAIASFSAPSLNFPAVTAGTLGTAQTITLTNSGTAALKISGIALNGSGSGLFSDTSTCGATLASGASCAIGVTFSPNTPGSYVASVMVTDNAADSPQSVPLTAAATPSALSIDTTNPADWKISNGTLSLDWNSQIGRLFSIHLAGHPDELVDTTSGNAGIYMDNAGFGGGTATATYTNAGTYLDWSLTVASNASNAYTHTEHFVITPNDPGIHVYFAAQHAATDVAGSIGQVQWVYRSNLTDFNNTYSVNTDLSNPGPVIVTLPPSSEMFSTDPGRDVQDATTDLHGFVLPSGFTKNFYTKYDHASYNYLHRAHGTFGSTYGVWAYFPSNESLIGGPTKQNLIYTGNLLILEAYSNHLANVISLAAPAGVASSRLFGPLYIRFNTIGPAYNTRGNILATPADMYSDALEAGASFMPFYDHEQQLLSSGYVASTARGAVSVQISGVSGAANTAWAVLSDPQTNFQVSARGSQYWADVCRRSRNCVRTRLEGSFRHAFHPDGFDREPLCGFVRGTGMRRGRLFRGA
jgi:hypothetical protein